MLSAFGVTLLKLRAPLVGLSTKHSLKWLYLASALDTSDLSIGLDPWVPDVAVLVDLVLPLAASLGEDVEVGPLHAPVLGLFGVKSLRRLRRRRGTANLEREKKP